jgi:hypothetical protein
MALRTNAGQAAIQAKYALRPDERDCGLRGDAAKDGEEQRWAVVHDGGGQERGSQLAMGPVTFTRHEEFVPSFKTRSSGRLWRLTFTVIAALHGDSARRALLVDSSTLRSDQSPVK